MCTNTSFSFQKAVPSDKYNFLKTFSFLSSSIRPIDVKTFFSRYLFLLRFFYVFNFFYIPNVSLNVNGYKNSV